MPQLNPDEAATDEPKTYNDEGLGRDEGHDLLNDIKGDLVDEDDGDEIRPAYNNKVEPHRNGDVVHRRKEDIDRDHPSDIGPTTRNFPYPQQDISSIVPGLNPLFSNGFLSSSSLNQDRSEIQLWRPEQNMVQQNQYISSGTTDSLASLETELSVLIETEYSNVSQSFPMDTSHLNSRIWDLVQRSVEVALQRDELRRAVNSFTNIIQSQVPYGPYMAPYVGSLFCGASSPIDLDGKQVPNRPPQPDVPPMYSLPGQLGQIPNPLAPWSPSPLYPLCTAAVTGMLRYPYPFPNFSSSGAMGSVSPFPLVPPHPHGGGIHPNMLHHGGLPFPNHLNGQNGGPKSAPDKKSSGSDGCSFKRGKNSEKQNRPYVKKPLNAFMLYMKEQRAQVVAECTLKESAAINQILGRKWHSLKRDEQQKYYDMARKERQLHMQMFPGWSARDNYGKRKKRKKEKTQDCAAQNPKKCRAVFGLDQQQLWCAPCRRKKKCIRYQHDDDDSDDSDCSPGPYQGQEMGSFPQSVGNQTFNSSDSAEQPSTVTSSNSTSSQSEDVASTERASPNQSALGDRIKQERSPPVSAPGNERTSNSSSSLFHSPAFSSAATESSSTSTLDAHCPSRSTSSNSVNPSTSLGSKHRSLTDESYPPPNANGYAHSSNKSSSETRDRRPNSHSESPLNHGGVNGPIGRHNIFNTPMLSPGISMSSPHNSPHAFLPNFSSYFAAASLPTSPLGGLMNLPNFKNLASPMNMGLKGPGSTGPPGGHPGANASRHTTSALEGKS